MSPMFHALVGNIELHLKCQLKSGLQLLLGVHVCVRKLHYYSIYSCRVITGGDVFRSILVAGE